MISLMRLVRRAY